MRHLVRGKTLSRSGTHRIALLRNMADSLIMHGRIETTLQKAKFLRPWAEKLVTLAKRNDLHARRRAFNMIRTSDALTKLFDEIGNLFKDRNGGYTRILKLSIPRVGDCAERALIEYIGAVVPKLGKAAVAKDKETKKAKGEKAEAPKKEKKAKAPKAPAPAKEAKAENKGASKAAGAAKKGTGAARKKSGSSSKGG